MDANTGREIDAVSGGRAGSIDCPHTSTPLTVLYVDYGPVLSHTPSINNNAPRYEGRSEGARCVLGLAQNIFSSHQMSGRMADDAGGHTGKCLLYGVRATSEGFGCLLQVGD